MTGLNYIPMMLGAQRIQEQYMELQAQRLEAVTYAEKQAVIVEVRRKVMAAMETGNPQNARTWLAELAEFDAAAAYTLRADVVRSYGQDI